MRYLGMKLMMALAMTLLTACASDNRFEEFQKIAEQRYGEGAANTAAELASLMNMLEQGEYATATKLERINDFFNSRIAFRDDLQVWQQSDYWASPLETLARGAGDCEDFVIAKFAALRLLNVPPSRLRLTYVRLNIGGPRSDISQAHMVLSYYPRPEAIPLVLDNIVGDIRPASRRPDLTPIFSFNDEELWVEGEGRASGYNPRAKMSRWHKALSKTRQDGFK